MADVPDAPDALVDAELWDNAAAAYVEVERECSALRTRLAEAERLLIAFDNLADRVGAHVAFMLGRYGDDPDARSLLAEHVEMSGRLMVYLDSLAGSATPPEAPQQTALARLAAMGAAQVYVHRIQAPAGEWRVMVRRFDGMDLVEKVQGFGATPDEAMRIWLALAGAVAPTEADR